MTDKTPTAGERLRHSNLVTQVRPAAEHLRRRFLGSVAAPFRDRVDMVAWIEDQPQYIPHRSNRPIPREVILPYRRPSAARPGRLVAWSCVGEPRSALRHFARGVHKLAGATDWEGVDVVDWLLLGIEPKPLPSVQWRLRIVPHELPDATVLRRVVADVRVRWPDVDESRWRSVRTAVRKAWKEWHAHGLTDRQADFRDVVLACWERHPPAKDFDRSFWTSVMEQLNAQDDNDEVTDYVGVARRFYRLQEKVGAPLGGRVATSSAKPQDPV